MPKRDLLTLADLSPEEIGRLLNRAEAYKKGDRARPLSGRAVGLLFEKSSTRTRVSFEVAVWRLGGLPIFLSFEDIQIKRGETVPDTARVLSGYLDALVIRTFAQEKLDTWAAHAAIPVINGLTDRYHPCQILADLFTIRQYRGRLAGLKLAYIGDGNNIAHSLLIGGAKVGMRVVVAAPEGCAPEPEVVAAAEREAQKQGGAVAIEPDPVKAADGADILYTDVWVSMGQEAERAARLRRLAPYQVNRSLLSRAKRDCLVMHCLPAHRGEEITGEVMEGPNSVIFTQSANRLPMQQAILETWMEKR